ncbi:MAG: hypothetical protein WAM66_11195 [Acidobacteriaceae bacterium]
MSATLVMWIVWAGVALILLILLGYRGTLTRYEEDQLFLDSAGNLQEQQQQSTLLLKVQRVTPYVRLAIGATCLMSALVIAYYVWQAVRSFG